MKVEGQLGVQTNKFFYSECVFNNLVFGFYADRKTGTQNILYLLPVECIVMWGEALNHEVLDNNEIIQNIFPGYFEKANKPHFISLSCH